MGRNLLSEESIDQKALTAMTTYHQDIVEEVKQAVKSHKIVVVGMGQNPVVKQAKKILEEKGLQYHFLSYGNYFSKWKQRLAIKLWSGWPTYPQVFIDGKLIGGASDLAKFLNK